jgi:hypothetical protein
MEAVRLLEGEKLGPLAACSRCQAVGCPWDRIAGRALCPDCQNLLVRGEAPALIESPRRAPCAVCRKPLTLPYVTFPLHTIVPLELDLCAEHIQALIARRLDAGALTTLARLLQTLGVTVQQVFLLHEAFYDAQGRPLQPVREAF